MNVLLFRKLIENKKIQTGDIIDATYEIYDEDAQSSNKKVKPKKIRGQYRLSRFYMDPFRFLPTVELLNMADEIINIEPQHITAVNGEALATLAASLNLRLDGMPLEAPKRRGRKPKVRSNATVEEDIEWDE